MAQYTQDERLARIDTPLGTDALLLLGLSGNEGMSQLFHYSLDLASEDPAVKFKDMIGAPVTVSLTLEDDSVRYFSGFISKFSQRDADDRLTYYHAEMVPWLWFLTRAADCRIFQKMKIPKIIEEVFKEAGFNDFELHLDEGKYDEWEYCVQYRETHFNFVSRLMEQYGIHYFFKHEKDKHILVLADSPDWNKPCPGQDSASYEPMQGVVQSSDVVQSWGAEQVMQPGKYVLSDYNFKTSGTNLRTSINTAINVGGNEGLEVYDYPGEYEKKDVGEKIVKLRMEEEEAVHKLYGGASTCRAFQSGFRFKLKDHEVSEFNQDYLITSVQHHLTQSAGYQSGEDGGSHYSNSITCIAHKIPFRPRRLTPKPVIQGVQTATVVGPSDEEIYTDVHGRIAVQFHWDRRGKYDAKSSCMIRVGQMWAGKKWGAMFIPRIGQEVIVTFLEGDPDQPLVIGSVYNDEHTPPYALPAEKSKSVIKSDSYKGGGGFNEIRLDDAKGKEQFFTHAERNQDARVKKDSLEWIGNDRHLIVKHDQMEKVEGNKHLSVKGDQNEKVDGTVSLKVGMDLQQKVGMKHGMDAGMEIHLKAGTSVVIEAGATLTLKVGGNFVNINPGGVFISGTMVMINSGGSAGTGSGASPAAPTDPKEADKAEAGAKAKPASAAAFTPVKFKPQKLSPPSPQTKALKDAAQNGTPFCAKCEAARLAAEG